MKKIILMLFLAVAFTACDQQKKERARLNNQIDSLRQELVTSKQMSETLHEVSILIDSIDKSRNMLRTSMVEGTTMADFQNRLSDINQYVKNSQAKIDELEKNLKGTHYQYAANLKKIKADLESRNKEILALQEQVAKYSNENKNLIQTVSLQKTEIEEKLALIKSNEDQNLRLHEQVNQLIAQSKLDEADYYYSKALALEETANRTKFAPRKKRKTNQEALELFELAKLAGKPEADAKITLLKKKI